MKQIVTFLIFIVCALSAHTQNILLNFPKLPGKEIKIYYSQGQKVDSLLVSLDIFGKGKTTLPAGYKGMLRIVAGLAGTTECVGGEPELQVLCNSGQLTRESVRFMGSKENEFLYNTFEEKSYLMQHLSWIEAGKQLMGTGNTVHGARNNWKDLLDEEDQIVSAKQTALEEKIRTSSLYAARFLQLLEFVNELFTAENKQDPAKVSYAKDYIHNKMNWEVLYTSGQFWGVVQNYYVSMFNKEFPQLSKEEKQQRYTKDILPLFTQVKNPIRTELLKSVIYECEQFGWDLAADSILTYITENKIPIGKNKDDFSRILSGYYTRPGNPAPSLEGFKLSPTPFKELLLVFYESGCGNCTTQLNELSEHYTELQQKGIRVITISADQDQNVYEHFAKAFPWKDKLCDYNGFEGINFRNYGILATPTIYVINQQGIIQGRYASLKDTELLK